MSRRFPTPLFLIALLALALGLAGCANEAAAVTPSLEVPAHAEQSAPTVTLEPTAELPTETPTPTAAPTEEPTPTSAPVGPSDFPPGVNPLTGLPVDDESVLARRPLIIKVSNQSDEVRPQSGLSSADHVWMYQAEGFRQTRYAAVYYSQAPEIVGSVRSARPIDVDLVEMYDALLAISGASQDMYRVLMETNWWNRVFRDDASGHFVRLPDRPNEGIDYYHTLFALPDVLWEHADERNVNGDDADLDGLLFDATPPEGGTPVEEMSIDYPEYGPRQIWRFDKESGRWLSWTEMQLDRPYEATEDVDYNTGEQLAFDNVVILWIPHFWRPDFIEVPAIDVEMIGEGEAVLLRDGLRYDVKWRRESPEHLIQLVDDAGNLVALKPGTTWFHAASTEDPFVSPPDKFVPQVTYVP